MPFDRGTGSGGSGKGNLRLRNPQIRYQAASGQVIMLKSTSRTALIVAGLLWCSLALAETVWIDVRSAEEYQRDHIEGDLRISHWEIVPGVTERFPDRDTEIRLYCRSGARAGKARSALEAAGYTNVSNVGGIDDARAERGLE